MHEAIDMDAQLKIRGRYNVSELTGFAIKISMVLYPLNLQGSPSSV